jgi:hypothetical protein
MAIIETYYGGEVEEEDESIAPVAAGGQFTFGTGTGAQPNAGQFSFNNPSGSGSVFNFQH